MHIRTVIPTLLFILSLVAPGVVADVAAGQAPPASRSAAYVEVETHITDAQGNPVRDLEQGDFTLLEDGVRQTIDTFVRVGIPTRSTDQAPAATDVVTNLNQGAGNVRLYTLLLDDREIARENADTTVQLAVSFIEHYLGPDDQVEIVSTSGSPDLRASFTSNKQLLLSTVHRFAGQRPDGFREQDRYQAAYSALQSLEAVAMRLGTITGIGKRLLFVSEGIGYDYQSNPGDEGAAAIAAQQRVAIAAATRANVTIYALDVSGWAADDSPTVDVARDSLRDAAKATGGAAFIAPVDAEEAFERIVQRSSDYYLLGYHPAKTRAEGKHRTIAIKANRAGIKIAARSGYHERDARSPVLRDPIPAIEDTSARLLQAINSPLPRSGMALSATAAAIRGEHDKTSVAVLLESPDVTLVDTGGKATGSVELLVVAVDANGRVATGRTGRMSFGTTPENASREDGKGLRTMALLADLAPGPYQIRIAAVDGNTSTQGSAWYAVDAPDFSRAGLTMSGLLLGSKAETPRVLNGWMELVAEMPVPPTTVREFHAGDELTVFAEVYDNAPEPDQSLTVVTRLAAADGTVVLRDDDTPSREELEAKKGMFRVRKPITLNGVAPGRYLVEVEAIRSGTRPSADKEAVIRRVPVTVLP